MSEQKSLMGVTSSITMEKNCLAKQPDFNDFDAVLYAVSRQGKATHLIFRDFEYTVGVGDIILVAPGIEFKMLEALYNKDTGTLQKMQFLLYSEDLHIRALRDWVTACRKEYEITRSNRLKEDNYYFDQIVSEDTKFRSALCFEIQQSTTNRSFNNVFFEEKEAVANRVKHFRDNRDWYSKRGIPYSFGLMFHGKPGSGKTSTIKAIMTETGRMGINVKLSKIQTATQLKNLFCSPVIQIINSETMVVERVTLPISKRLYIIDDIDAMALANIRDYSAKFAPKSLAQPKISSVGRGQREVKEPIFEDGDAELESYFSTLKTDAKTEMATEAAAVANADCVTLDILLNLLDGTLEIPGRMICITTNHLEVIDPALIRPGRVDMIIEFKHANRAIIQQMFESFYDRPFDKALFGSLEDYKISPAKVNQILFNHFTAPESALADLRLKMFEPLIG